MSREPIKHSKVIGDKLFSFTNDNGCLKLVVQEIAKPSNFCFYDVSDEVDIKIPDFLSLELSKDYDPNIVWTYIQCYINEYIFNLKLKIN